MSINSLSDEAFSCLAASLPQRQEELESIAPERFAEYSKKLKSAQPQSVSVEKSSKEKMLGDIAKTVDEIHRFSDIGSSNICGLKSIKDVDRSNLAAQLLGEAVRKNTDLVSEVLRGGTLNCGPLSSITHEMIQGKNIEAKIFEDFPGADHAVVVANLNASRPLDVDSFPLEIKKWPEDVRIIDPLFNISCIPAEFPKKFEQKMESLTAQGLKLHTKLDDGTEGWIKPNDRRWRQGVLSPRIDWEKQAAGGL